MTAELAIQVLTLIVFGLFGAALFVGVLAGSYIGYRWVENERRALDLDAPVRRSSPERGEVVGDEDPVPVEELLHLSRDFDQESKDLWKVEMRSQGYTDEEIEEALANRPEIDVFAHG